MINLTSIKERISYFIENQGVKISQFYTESGVSYGILSQKSKITEDNIVRFLTKYSVVNAEWLILGKGEMLKSNNYEQTIQTKIVYKSDPKDAEIIASYKENIEFNKDLIAANKETIETQRKLIASLENKIADLEKLYHPTKPTRNTTGLRSVPAADSIYPNQTGVKPK
ncbi:MAG: hypothetical protein SNJ29_15345 [Rikenellaceae bacterium]